jgi:group I intron endonuclease
MVTIYKITNKVNGKLYIGQTKYPLPVRMSGHLTDSKRTKTKLSNAINKYGKEVFEIEEIISGDFNIEFADYLESHYIRLYASTFQYNIKTGGNSVPMTEETRRKISVGNKGKKNPKPISYKDADRYGPDKLEIVKRNRSIGHMGVGNHKSKKVVNNLTGEVYSCISEAAIKNGMERRWLSTLLHSNSDKVNMSFYK